MADPDITDRDRRFARLCQHCTVCRYARKRQRGLVYNFVNKVEKKFCPFCRAYKKVYGREAHEPAPSGRHGDAGDTGDGGDGYTDGHGHTDTRTDTD